ncbi:hypothetical protein MYX77_05315 [Acidobacteriia bacterium AH_259_A11_L15]|nr:hypothetical protein [Acidobacteriia bacterium AH_259_A11_L15]
MRQRKGNRRGLTLILALFVCGCGAVVSAQHSPPYSKEEPIWLDFDMESIPEPEGFETGYVYDFLNGTIFQQVKQAFDFPRHFRKLAGKPREAYNVNTLDKVPDSSWFTNRNGRRRLSLEEIKRGPNENDGPAEGPLTVVRGKTAGLSPGFWVLDQEGDIYILKFDPPEYPELATAAEVISTKLFYAIGYNVPQNTIFRFRREQLRLDPDAPFTDHLGRRRTMTEADLEEILQRSAQQPNGQYRAVASKLLKGKPLGGFSFVGVRADDPNDIIPHEHRRDLRGLRVFCAWLEHNDIRLGNTMDLYVTEDGRSFVRHYLIDFGSTLGSDTIFPNVPIVGHEYQFDAGEATKVLLSLGIYQQPWLDRKHIVRYPSVGIYNVTDFDPPNWKQNFPLVAFENMTDHDAYWAAKIVGSFTDEQIWAAVETGELSDPEAARYLAEQISQRRDKIVRYYLYRRAALDRFRIEQSGTSFLLRFEDLREEMVGRKQKPDNYDYGLRCAAEPKKLIDSGSISQPLLTFSSELLDQFGGCGRTAADRHVARLTLRRPGESHVVQVYLYFDTARAELRLVGVQP